jgi:hypothetical protein
VDKYVGSALWIRRSVANQARISLSQLLIAVASWRCPSPLGITEQHK